MRDRVIQLISLQKTADHLFEAALHSKSDAAEVLLERTILGKWMSTCAGALRVVRRFMIDQHDRVAKKLVFEGAYAKVHRHPSKNPSRGLPPPSDSGVFEVVGLVILSLFMMGIDSLAGRLLSVIILARAPCGMGRYAQW